MAGTADVTRRIFDPAKRFMGRKYQQLRELFDWDVNEDSDEQRWWKFTEYEQSLGSVSVGFGNTADHAFFINEAGVPVNNVDIQHGYAIANGRPVWTEGTGQFLLDDTTADPVNYILKGTVTSFTEITPGSDYLIFDTEKNYVTNHGLDGSTKGEKARVHFISGSLSGQVFDIDSQFSSTGFQVLGNLAGVGANDTFIILPPKPRTPLVVPQTDSLHLVTWLEEVSDIEDNILEDPVLSVTPSYRLELRWMVYLDWPGTDDTDHALGFKSSLLGSFTRTTIISDIFQSDITNGSPQFTVSPFYSELQSIKDTSNNADTQSSTNTTDLASYKIHSAVQEYQRERSGSLGMDSSGNIRIDSGAAFWGLAQNTPFPQFINFPTALTSGLSTPETRVYSERINATFDTATREDNTAAGNAIDAKDTIIALFRRNSPTEQRVMRFGDRSWQKGFDWFNESGGMLTISPGESYRFGNLYQNAANLTIDPNLPASYVGGALPIIGSWAYIYLYDNIQIIERGLGVILSTDPPNYSGEYQDVDALRASVGTNRNAFCIGAIIRGAGFIGAHCQNNKVFLEDSVPIVGDIIGNGVSVVSSVALPGIGNRGTMSIRKTIGTDDPTDAISLTFRYKNSSGTNRYSRNFGILSQDVGGGQVRVPNYPLHYEIPLNMAYVAEIEATGYAVGSSVEISIDLISYEFNPIHMPNRVNFFED